MSNSHSTPVKVTPAQVVGYRLRRSGLLSPFPSSEEAAEALFGVQAQIHPAAGLALWNRTVGLTHSRYAALLYDERTLVKLWGQRGTLHAYASHEWPLVYAAFADRKTWWGVSAAQQDRVNEYARLVEQAADLLRDRGAMGRSDLLASGLVLDEDHLSPWGGLFADLVRCGYACHAGRSGNEGMFAHRDYWLPNLAWNPPPTEEANNMMVRRYVHTYGPTTAQDYAYWRGGRSEPARGRWERVQPDLVEVAMEGGAGYVLREDLDELLLPTEETDWPLHMLYRFDPLLLAHKAKQWIVPAAHYGQVWRPAGHIEGIVLVGGRAVATWRYTRKAGGLVVEVAPFRKLLRTVQRQIERKAGEIAGFFETPLLGVAFDA